jgi:hypothetical protein
MLVYRTRVYERRCRKLFSEYERQKAEEEILTNPAKWPVMKASGGIRKARASLGNRGKQGGARVIYFWLDQHNEVYLLTAYAKNERTDLSAAELKEWNAFAATIRKEKEHAN